MSDRKDRTTLKTEELERPDKRSTFDRNSEIGNAAPAAQLHCQNVPDDTVVPFGRHVLTVPNTDEGTLRIELGAPKPLGYEQIDALLPYDGARGVVHRSTWAKTGMFVAATEEDGGLPRPVGHESALERAT